MTVGPTRPTAQLLALALLGNVLGEPSQVQLTNGRMIEHSG